MSPTNSNISSNQDDMTDSASVYHVPHENSHALMRYLESLPDFSDRVSPIHTDYVSPETPSRSCHESVTTGEEDPGVLSDAPSQQSLEQDTRPSVVGDFSLPPHQTEGTQTGSNVPPSYKGPGAASIKTTSKTFVQTEEIRGGASKHARLTFDSIINRKATRSRHDEHNKKHAAWQAGDYPTFAEKRSRLLAKLGFRSKQTSYATDSLDLGELPGPIIYIPTGSGSQERSMPEPSMSDSAASPRQDNSLQLPCSTLDIRKTRTHMPPPH